MQSFKMLLRMTALSFILIGLSITSSHSAMVEYSYQGNLFTNIIDRNPPSGTNFSTTDSVTGSFIVSDYLGANLSNQAIAYESFTLSAGTLTLASTDSDFLQAILEITTDGDSVITDWNISISAGINLTDPAIVPGDKKYFLQSRSDEGGTRQAQDQGRIRECLIPAPPRGCGTSDDYGYVVGDEGEWTAGQIGAVPVPAAVWLFGTALIGLVGFGRRKVAA